MTQPVVGRRYQYRMGPSLLCVAVCECEHTREWIVVWCDESAKVTTARPLRDWNEPYWYTRLDTWLDPYRIIPEVKFAGRRRR